MDVALGFRNGAGLLAALEAQAGGLLTEVEYDHTEDRVVCKRTQDVEPILKYCSESRQDGTNGYSPDKLMRHAYEIPMVIVEKWLHERCDCDKGEQGHGFNVGTCSQAALRRKLRDYAAFKVCDGAF